MKNLLFILSTFYLNISFAQTNIFPATGKVGIGLTSPSSQLEMLTPATSGIESLMKLRVSDAASDYFEITNGTGLLSTFLPAIKGRVISTYNTALFVVGETDAANDVGTIPLSLFDSRLGAAKVNNRPLFGWASYGTRYMTMLANGNLGIGTAVPTEKLSVNGKIRAKEIKVDAANWPDYVFEQAYSLPALSDVKSYVNQNQHLPDIPSAKEVSEKGIDLGVMNAKLLKKVEELTLYLIEKDEEIKESKKKMQVIEERLNRLISTLK